MCWPKRSLFRRAEDRVVVIFGLQQRSVLFLESFKTLIVSPLHTLKGQSVQRLKDTTERLPEELGGMDNVANEEEAADVELGNRDISMVLEDEERRDENDEDRGWDLPPDTNTPKIAH
ncbi:hypothetical protein BC332_11842 [Capsicum chinense]|nr:hypothetical protein BC332_11842 [Capsicum chinense]